MPDYPSVVPHDPSIKLVEYLREPLTDYLNTRESGTLSSYVNWLIRRDLERRGYDFSLPSST